MKIRKHIPNTVTCLNLVSGCIAAVVALQGDLLSALLWIVLAAVFDFFDGLLARLLKAYSPMGKELDSLADVVSFGVAPGMILFHLLGTWSPSLSCPFLASYLPYMAFVVPAFSGLRLAKFNIDERQTTSFIGLPVPAHALLLASAAYSLQTRIGTEADGWLIGLVVAVFCLTSYLLVSEIPMFSLKIKSLAWKGNEVRYLLLTLAIVFIGFWGFMGIAATILLYILLSALSSRS